MKLEPEAKDGFDRDAAVDEGEPSPTSDQSAHALSLEIERLEAERAELQRLRKHLQRERKHLRRTGSRDLYPIQVSARPPRAANALLHVAPNDGGYRDQLASLRSRARALWNEVEALSSETASLDAEIGLLRDGEQKRIAKQVEDDMRLMRQREERVASRAASRANINKLNRAVTRSEGTREAAHWAVTLLGFGLAPLLGAIYLSEHVHPLSIVCALGYLVALVGVQLRKKNTSPQTRTSELVRNNLLFAWWLAALIFVSSMGGPATFHLRGGP